MLSTKIKEATKAPHQQLEGVVVRKLKAIKNEGDYADFLKYFYAYFNAVEKAIKPYITKEVLPDYGDRRNSSYLRNDIEALKGTIDDSPEAHAPAIGNIQEALGALYVLEGSIMGGSIIVKMLEKLGITKGISFFSGYGEGTGQKWALFIEVLNKNASSEGEEALAINAAGNTFEQFGKVFEQEEVPNN
ncbi:biliverdin-producing heme oxygenase [Olivibacter domesticus]|uniref:Heme oxygenase n=1 Tax=Olivibacter domesticus TaxID=407022 RepID=A0A1H7W3S1_OLID1|nr:biliverdin-producing heme oxygenase [Olivibacter domesticus]SEM16183.1 heme oxygenase [Olivibacter domesticus]